MKNGLQLLLSILQGFLYLLYFDIIENVSRDVMNQDTEIVIKQRTVVFYLLYFKSK